MQLAQYLGVAAMLFCIGAYGVMVRRNGVMVLMAVELMLSAVILNLVAFGAFRDDPTGQVFALFVVAIAAAEVGVGLAIVLLIYRHKRNVDFDEIDEMRG